MYHSLTEAYPDKAGIVPALTFEDFQELLAPTAGYMDRPNPGLILRAGLVEEALEAVAASPDDPEEQYKEVGDVLWYETEAARLHGYSLGEIAGGITGYRAPTLTGFQEYVDREEPAHLPVFGTDGQPVAIKGTDTALLLAALRVVDVLNPVTHELWRGYVDRPALPVVLGDALASLARFASGRRISIEVAAQLTLSKLLTRTRRPHVLDAGAALTSSGRERLLAHPGIAPLLGRTALS